MVLVFAHRGFSGREPEMTTAAYRAAIEWAAAHQVPLGLECDVHFSADGELICLHDDTVDRTSNASGPAYRRTLAELRALDFGSWRVADPSAEQSALVTLADLLAMVRDARAAGTDVTLAIETKHPHPRGRNIERSVAELLGDFGWAGAGSPVRLISFSAPAVTAIGRLLPTISRTLLINRELGRWVSGRLPAGVRIAGLGLNLLRSDPDFVARARAYGNEVHVWTVNEPDDIGWCLDLGVAGITSDHPDRVFEVASHAELADALSSERSLEQAARRF